MKRTPSLFIRGWIKGMCGNRGGQNNHMVMQTPRFSGCSLKDKDLLGYSGPHAKLMRNDIMAV